MKQAFAGIGVVMLAWLAGTHAAEQQAAPAIDLKYEMEAARKLIEKERRVVIAGEMFLTDSERQPFWDTYSDYAAEMAEINMAYVGQIRLYAANFERMSDDVAKELLAGYFQIERDTLKVREKYRKRFAKVLPVIKVARFYQVENKLDAVYDFQLASQIPMIEETGKN